MNRNKLMVFSIFGLFLIGIIFWLLSFGKRTEVVSSKSKPPKAQTPVTKVETQKPLGGDDAVSNYIRKSTKDPEWDWKQPINFYGKVVDEDRKPVEGAEIEFGWTSMEPGKGHSEAKTLSDVQGLFSLTDARGKNLGVHVKKEGYHTSYQTKSSFEYANPAEDIYHKPDPNNPVIFHLKKKGATELLVSLKQKLGIEKKMPVFFDLIRGKVGSNSGELQITLIENAGNPAKWTMIISVPNGGIIWTEEEFPAIAPESGYATEVEINFDSKNPPRWEGVYKGGRFYVKTKKGYGLVELKMVPGSEYFRIISFFNPSGSRNLEYDSEKEITQQRIADVGLEKALEEARSKSK